MQEPRRPAWLVLEDGSLFAGEQFGAPAEAEGEVVFTTVPTGYQEVLTDPSYRGQIVVFTQPLIGNYGTYPGETESERVQVRAVVARELYRGHEGLQGRQSLDAWLAQEGVVGVAGIDTRALTRLLRSRGTLRGVVALSGADVARLQERAREVPDLGAQDLVGEVLRAGNGASPVPDPSQVLPPPVDRPRVVVMDFGVKRHIVQSLEARGCQVIAVPGLWPHDRVLAYAPDGVVLSNGPGDPAALPQVVHEVEHLMGRVPLLGICLGHQLLGLALGGRTYKLKFGHRGGNHPVKDLGSGRVYITTQNHGYAVDEQSLPRDVEVTHRSLNDGTVEGMRHRRLPVWSVQYHPEASPGPRDSTYLFDGFVAGLAARRSHASHG